jgi:hypothetical protein
MKVYDILGQEVATLANGMQEAGNRSVTWDASTSSSGVYFIRLDATAAADGGKSALLSLKVVLQK